MATPKYRIIHVNTIEDVKNMFFDNEYREDLGRYRNLFVYRGLPDPSYELKTSIQRICKDQKEKLEPIILQNFAKYAELDNPTVNDSVWKQMIIGQHHGLPTRLLDWSASPLTALHFATTEGNLDELDQHDCVVWRIDIKKFNSLLPDEYKKKMDNRRQDVFTIDMLKDISLKKYDEDMGDTSMIMLEPPTIDMRIANQYSFFSIVPSKVNIVEDILNECGDSVVKYIISRNLRWQIRDMLDQVNVSERTVYPGLDGIASWLSRHYYVRNLHKISIVTRNIAKADVDVIVNPANRYLLNTGGAGKAIFAGAGEELNQEIESKVKQHHMYNVGEIESTKGYNLSCRAIYHAVVPVFDDDTYNSQQTLEHLYKDLLTKVLEDDYHSVAIPLLSSGAGGLEKNKAWDIAIDSCKSFLKEHTGSPLTIKFYVLSEEDAIEGNNTLNRHIKNGQIEDPNEIDFHNHLSYKNLNQF